MTVEVEIGTKTDGILLTDGAAVKVKNLLDQEGRDDLSLRVQVEPGGCSGLRYQLYFDDRSLDGDVVSEFGGVKVVTDRMSAPYLIGATVDFVDTIEKQGFTIDNPNATGSCACGESFNSSDWASRAPEGPGKALRLGTSGRYGHHGWTARTSSCAPSESGTGPVCDAVSAPASSPAGSAGTSGCRCSGRVARYIAVNITPTAIM